MLETVQIWIISFSMWLITISVKSVEMRQGRQARSVTSRLPCGADSSHLFRLNSEFSYQCKISTIILLRFTPQVSLTLSGLFFKDRVLTSFDYCQTAAFYTSMDVCARKKSTSTHPRNVYTRGVKLTARGPDQAHEWVLSGP